MFKKSFDLFDFFFLTPKYITYKIKKSKSKNSTKDN